MGGLPGGWVLKLKLMLTQPPTELELELGLSLAIYSLLPSQYKCDFLDVFLGRRGGVSAAVNMFPNFKHFPRGWGSSLIGGSYFSKFSEIQ